MRVSLTRDWLSRSDGDIRVIVETPQVDIGGVVSGRGRVAPSLRWETEGGLVLTLLEVCHGDRRLPRALLRLPLTPRRRDADGGAECAFSVRLPPVLDLERHVRCYYLEAGFPDIESRTTPGQAEIHPRLPAVFAQLEAAVLAAGDFRCIGQPGQLTLRQGKNYLTFGYAAKKETRALVDGIVLSLAFEPEAIRGWVTVDRRERTVAQRVRAPFTDEDKRLVPLYVPHDRLLADPAAQSASKSRSSRVTAADDW